LRREYFEMNMDVLLQNFLRQQDYALLEYLGDGSFALLAEPPQWFREIWGPQPTDANSFHLGETSPFLENFLIDAEVYWGADSASESPAEGWIERTRDGKEIPLDVLALRVAGKRVLAIQSRPAAFAEQSRILQTARDGLLVHERLLKEIQKKEILLHCIIHDLSQPLTAMRGCFECLALEGGGTARAKQLVDMGKQQSEQQEEMIREVLKAFSSDLQDSMQDGDTAPELPDILRCAAETVEAFTPVFRAKGLIVRLDPRLQGHAPWHVMGEATRLKRIFSNLVENALRHAPSGSIVTLGLDDDEPYVKAFVEDQGAGLPKDFLASRAFKLFSKGKEGGGKAGLGLYFCRITVERWGGTIGCEDVVPHGARFWFRLLSATEQTVAAPNIHTPSSASRSSEVASVVRAAPSSAGGGGLSTADSADKPVAASRMRVLLADDNPAIRELTELLLSRQGYRVVAVANGLEALRVLASRRFDVVLLDDEMPKLGGSETAKRIREQEAGTGKHQVILALTGNTSDADKLRLQSAGVDACLSKPFRAEELNRALASFAKAPASVPVTPAAPAVQPEASDEAALLARVGGDRKLLVRLIHTFLKDYPKKLAQLRTAVRVNDASTLAATAHAIKGPIGIFGATRAKEYAQELQDAGRSAQLAGAAKTLERLEEEIAKLEKKLRGYTTRASRAKSGQGKGKIRGRAKKKRA
jgi:signal transduction histidine kinase/HPt (histidine-containing phosphotransfer) domain-containing protein/ActR/RegA family two-component response regulator